MGKRNSRSAWISSRVVPFFPRLWEAGFRGVVIESADVLVVNEDESTEEVMVVPV
jgi:hypothetical protein